MGAIEKIRLEEHLNNWDLTADALVEKYGLYKHSVREGYVHISSTDYKGNYTYILLGDYECFADFYFYDFSFGCEKPSEITVLPVLPEGMMSDGCSVYSEEYQQVKVNYNLQILKSVFGDNYEEWVPFPHGTCGYTWHLPGCSISTHVGYDTHGDPNGGNINIHFKKQ